MHELDFILGNLHFRIKVPSGVQVGGGSGGNCSYAEIAGRQRYVFYIITDEPLNMSLSIFIFISFLPFSSQMADVYTLRQSS